MSKASTTAKHAGESVESLARAAKAAARKIAAASAGQRNQALAAIAEALERNSAQILAANAEDVRDTRAAVARGELTKALVDRLELSPDKLASMIAGVRAVASLPDPIGRVLEPTQLDTGLQNLKKSAARSRSVSRHLWGRARKPSPQISKRWLYQVGERRGHFEARP